jgi:predicted nucleic acid-binding protein
MLERPFRATEAWGVVSLLLESRELDVLSATSNHARVAGSTLAESPEASGNVMHDIHTLILMREHGVRRIATRDKDFRRFRGIEAVDPVQAD